MYKRQESPPPEYDPPRSFTLTAADGRYHVRYSFNEEHAGVTRLQYHEWVDTGELENPFRLEPLVKLRALVEGLTNG